jgi:hypothetical protein
MTQVDADLACADNGICPPPSFSTNAPEFDCIPREEVVVYARSIQSPGFTVIRENKLTRAKVPKEGRK